MKKYYLLLILSLIVFPMTINAEVKTVQEGEAAYGKTNTNCYDTKEECGDSCSKVEYSGKSCYVDASKTTYTCYYESNGNHRDENSTPYKNYIRIELEIKDKDYEAFLNKGKETERIKFYSEWVEMQSNIKSTQAEGIYTPVQAESDVDLRTWYATEKNGIIYYTCPSTITVTENKFEDKYWSIFVGSESSFGGNYSEYTLRKGDNYKDGIMAVSKDSISSESGNPVPEELSELPSCSDDASTRLFWDSGDTSVNDKCFVCSGTDCKGKMTINTCTKRVFLIYKNLDKQFDVDVNSPDTYTSFFQFTKKGMVNDLSIGIFEFEMSEVKGTETHTWSAYAKNGNEYNLDIGHGEIIINKVDQKQCPVDGYQDGDEVYGCEIIPPEITKWIKNILNIVKYVALALVIALGALDFMKAAGSGEPDQMKKAGQSFMKRVAAVVILFLVPVIVDLILNLINLYGAGGTCIE